MKDENNTSENEFCPRAECNRDEAAAAALAVGLYDEFRAGTYTCCQVMQWADEQWQAWHEAEMMDSTEPISSAENAGDIPVYIRKRRDRESGAGPYFPFLS